MPVMLSRPEGDSGEVVYLIEKLESLPEIRK
jgi:hypothetical protein